MSHRPSWQEACVAAACAVLLWAPPAGAAWNEPVGGERPINEPGAAADQLSMAVAGGIPYLARQERSAAGADVQSDLRVSLLDAAGSDWVPVGGAANSTLEETEGAEIALVDGVPHVASWEGPLAANVEVQRYDATTDTWSRLGGFVDHIPLGSDVFLAIVAHDGEPWVAVSDGNLLHVLRFDGSDWVQVGLPLNANPSDPAGDVDIAVIAGRPWAAWVEAGQVRVARLNDTADGWTEVVGGASPVNASPTGVARQVRLAAVGDVPYVAWTEQDAAGDHQVRVSRLNGAGDDWEEQVGGASPIGVAAGVPAGSWQRFVALAAASGEPYVAFVDPTGVPHVERVAATGWEEVGVGGAPIADFARDVELVEIGGVPYVGYEDAAGQARVERLDAEIVSASETVDPTAATLFAEVRTFGVAYPPAFFFDTGSSPTTQFGSRLIRSDNTGTAVASLPLLGLSPTSLYSWKATVGDGTREIATSGVRTFVTPAAPAPLGGQPDPQPEPQQQEQPQPDLGSTFTAEETRGEVFVKLRGSDRYVSLEGLREIPLGSVVDADEGRVRINAAGDGGSAVFYAGIFKVLQTKGARPITEARLVKKLAACPSGKGAVAAAAKRRRLWGDGKGRFRTRGRYSSGAVRGTKWLVEDRCSGTLTRVRRGSVTVSDFVTDERIVVKAGGSYLAHP
jgi:hypothetical protein